MSKTKKLKKRIRIASELSAHKYENLNVQDILLKVENCKTVQDISIKVGSGLIVMRIKLNEQKKILSALIKKLEDVEKESPNEAEIAKRTKNTLQRAVESIDKANSALVIKRK